MSTPQKERPTVEGRGGIGIATCKKATHLTAPVGVAQHHPDSHPARILAALLAGESLTAASAWRRFGTSRLAAVVHALRRDGWPVETRTITVKTARGRFAHVAEYHLGGVS